MLQFDGYGTITVTSLSYPDSSWYNGTGSYSVSGNVVTFSVVDYDWTCTLNEDGTMHVVYDDGDYYADGDLTKTA